MQLNQEALTHVEAHPDIKVLKRVPFTGDSVPDNLYPMSIDPVVGDEISVIILDLETTGLNKNENEIIELGLIKLKVSPSMGTISEIQGCLSLFEQPSTPITEEITKITGITNEQVHGHKIDTNKVELIFRDAQLVIAHNASFDRGFFDKRFPTLDNLPWACSIKDVDWTVYGLEGNKLLYLLFQCGYFYDAHRADTDCIATLRLFQDNPGSMLTILSNALVESTRIHCFFAPFNVKDHLKERGYRWQNDGDRHWIGLVKTEDLAAEWEWLKTVCPRTVERFTTEQVTRFNRYK